MITALHRAAIALSLATLALLITPSAATAQQSSAELARRNLIHEAELARRAGDHTLAVERAGRAVQIRSTPSLRMMLAQEQLSLGHSVDALDHARECVREAQANPSLRFRTRILSVCRTVITRAEAAVGTIIVHVPSPAPDGLRVTLRGAELPAALWGVAYPLTPGPAELVATAPTYFDYNASLSITARSETTATLALQPRPAPPPPPPPLPSPITTAPTPPRVCIPGQQLRCACANATSGTQTCNLAGTALQPCECSTSINLQLPSLTPPAPVHRYAAQTLLVDLAASAFLLGGLFSDEPIVTGIGAGIALLGAPIVHSIHRRPLTALGDVFLRAGLSGLGALSAYAAITANEGTDRDPTVPTLIGAGVGYVLALIIDAYALTEYSPATPSSASPNTTSR